MTLGFGNCLKTRDVLMVVVLLPFILVAFAAMSASVGVLRRFLELRALQRTSSDRTCCHTDSHISLYSPHVA